MPRIRSHLGLDVLNGVNDFPLGTSGLDTSPDSATWQAVLFKHDRMYKHNVMRINYTGYDVRRGEDVIHAGTNGQCNVMVLAPESAEIGPSYHENQHPFWYARVLGIYHVNVVYIGEGNADYLPCRLEFLWVRWYELEERDSGWSSRRLDRAWFMPLTDEHAFGFLDPDDVLRACHMIPVFREGLTCEKGPGISCCDQGHDHTDWKSYYINRCVSFIPRVCASPYNKWQICRQGHGYAVSLGPRGGTHIFSSVSQNAGLSHW